MLNRILIIAAVMTVVDSGASAEVVAVSTSNVNLRAGPSTSYPSVTVVPENSRIVTHGCVSDYTWCDITFGSARGWMSAQYIQVVSNGTAVVLAPAVAPTVGVTVVAFNRAYWDSHYVSYPWYGSWASYPAYRPGISQSNNVVGPQGGTAAGVRGCGPQGCGAAGAVTGPAGNTTAGVRGCGPQGCGAAVVGPQGNTTMRRIDR